MASLYTDEAREKRYDALRAKSEQCNTAFKWLPRITAGALLIVLFAQPLIARSLDIGSALPLIIAVLVGLSGALLRNPVPAAAGIIGVVLATAVGWESPFCVYPLMLIPLGVILYFTVVWMKLQKEEGFPYFRIPLSEYEDRRKAQAAYIEQRAVNIGVRREQAELDPNRDMDDLLDQNTDAVHAQLHSYHDRSRDSDPVVRAAEAHDGTMTKLEDMEEL